MAEMLSSALSAILSCSEHLMKAKCEPTFSLHLF